MTIHTRKQLAEAVNLAYDEYWYAIQALGQRFGITPPSPRLVGDDPRSAGQAKVLWATFQQEQHDANDEFFESQGVG